MADHAMELRSEHLEQIGLYVRGNLGAWFKEANLDRDMELRERTIRVEEELKTQRDLMREGFAQVDKRLESMQHSTDKRFEQVDKRFDDLQRSIRNGQWFIGLLVTFVMAASTAVQVLL
jgi:hypothetical protein